MTSGKTRGMSCEALKAVFNNHSIEQPTGHRMLFLKADIFFIVDLSPTMKKSKIICALCGSSKAGGEKENISPQPSNLYPMFSYQIVQSRAAGFEQLCCLRDIVSGEQQGPLHTLQLTLLTCSLQR